MHAAPAPLTVSGGHNMIPQEIFALQAGTARPRGGGQGEGGLPAHTKHTHKNMEIYFKFPDPHAAPASAWGAQPQAMRPRRGRV